MSSNKIENDIKQIKEFSKKALSIVTQQQRESKVIENECISCFNKLNNSKKSLELLVGMLTKQMEESQILLKTVKQQATTLTTSLTKLYNRNYEILKETRKNIERLKKKPLSEIFHKYIPPNIPEQNRTYSLYDFVDVENVELLENQAYGELLELQKITNYVLKNMEILEHKNEVLVGLEIPSVPAEADLHVDEMKSKIDKLRIETNSIQHLALMVASFHDRLNHTLDGASSESFGTGLDVKYFTDGSKRVKEQISKISQLLEKVSGLKMIIENSCKSVCYEESFVDCSMINTLLTEFGKATETYSSHLSQYTKHLEDHTVGWNDHYRELKMLSYFYDIYDSAYDEMLYEIARRKREFERAKEMVTKYRRDLEQWRIEEAQTRENFHEHYGKFLPPSIFPPLNPENAAYDTIPCFKILPEVFYTNLPDIQLLPCRNDNGNDDNLLFSEMEKSPGSSPLVVNTNGKGEKAPDFGLDILSNQDKKEDINNNVKDVNKKDEGEKKSS